MTNEFTDEAIKQSLNDLSLYAEPSTDDVYLVEFNSTATDNLKLIHVSTLTERIKRNLGALFREGDVPSHAWVLVGVATTQKEGIELGQAFVREYIRRHPDWAQSLRILM